MAVDSRLAMMELAQAAALDEEYTKLLCVCCVPLIMYTLFRIMQLEDNLRALIAKKKMLSA